uniref:Uncharacterized protein n=1 Tax=Timema genevievae TaxID=629358 RepID=A0A7R9K0C9_TIMGE|nr:unnamed protein product [Timema genevievae]
MIVILSDKATKASKNESSSNIVEVIDDLVDAAIGATPKNHYIPGITRQILPKLSQLLNESIVDFMLDLKLYVPVAGTSAGYIASSSHKAELLEKSGAGPISIKSKELKLKKRVVKHTQKKLRT